MEFIVHVKDEYDYRFICEERDELFEALKQCYFNFMNCSLLIFVVPSKLKEFATSKKDIKAGTERLPPDSYVLPSENLFDPLTLSSSKSASDTRLDVSQEDLLPQVSHRPTYVK